MILYFMTFIVKVNNQQMDKYNAIAYTTVEMYVSMNPSKTADEVFAAWEPFKSCSMRSWFLVTDEQKKDIPERYANYSYEVKCADGKSVWVNKDGRKRATGATSIDTVKELIDAINGNPSLGISITTEIM